MSNLSPLSFPSLIKMVSSAWFPKKSINDPLRFWFEMNAVRYPASLNVSIMLLVWYIESPKFDASSGESIIGTLLCVVFDSDSTRLKILCRGDGQDEAWSGGYIRQVANCRLGPSLRQTITYISCNESGRVDCASNTKPADVCG